MVEILAATGATLIGIVIALICVCAIGPLVEEFRICHEVRRQRRAARGAK